MNHPYKSIRITFFYETFKKFDILTFEASSRAPTKTRNLQKQMFLDLTSKIIQNIKLFFSSLEKYT